MVLIKASNEQMYKWRMIENHSKLKTEEELLAKKKVPRSEQNVQMGFSLERVG